jgi:hypothetical protein
VAAARERAPGTGASFAGPGERFGPYVHRAQRSWLAARLMDRLMSTAARGSQFHCSRAPRVFKNAATNCSAALRPGKQWTEQLGGQFGKQFSEQSGEQRPELSREQRGEQPAELLGPQRSEQPGPQLAALLTGLRSTVSGLLLRRRWTKDSPRQCPGLYLNLSLNLSWGQSPGWGCQFFSLKPKAPSRKHIAPKTRSRRLIRICIIRGSARRDMDSRQPGNSELWCLVSAF